MPAAAGASGLPPASPVRIEARGYGFRHAGRKAWAVRGLDLVIEPGERVLLLGTSGAGKSTLLTALAGLLDPDTSGDSEGVLLVDGRDPRAARAGTALVMQDPQSQLVMERAGDDVAFGLENRGVPREQIWPQVRDALDAVAFGYAVDRSTRSLSGGEQQRLVLAGALAMSPGLLLLDEPTANLDPAGAALVRAAIEAVQRRAGATTLLVEHRVAEALPLVDRVVVLRAGGGLLADGTPEQVLVEQGGWLAAAGVWVPGYPPAVPARTARRRPGVPLLAARGVAHRYADSDFWALPPTDVDVHVGEVLAITGPNGAGKTTFAWRLAGLTRPQAGSVTAAPALTALASAGTAIGPLPYRWQARELVTRIGTVFQDPEHQFLTARVRDELALGPLRVGRRAAEVRGVVDDLLDRLRLTRLAQANPYTLSGGEKRRLSVATALATVPALLVLDEPTFGQDRRTWEELVALLAAHADDGGAVCAVTHDRALVQALADAELTLPMAPSTVGAAAREGVAP